MNDKKLTIEEFIMGHLWFLTSFSESIKSKEPQDGSNPQKHTVKEWQELWNKHLRIWDEL